MKNYNPDKDDKLLTGIFEISIATLSIVLSIAYPKAGIVLGILLFGLLVDKYFNEARINKAILPQQA